MTRTMVDGEARTRDGVRLSYTHMPASEGAPRIAFVHSLALDRSLWSRVIPLLADETEILVYDCRGHGRSERPEGPYDTGQFADDLAGLLDHLGWRDAVVAGCSMGGCVAQAFSARHRDRTRGALLIDTTAWYGPTAAADWADRAAKARRDGLAALVPFQLTRWFGDAFREREPELMERLAEVFTGNDIHAYEATCAMLGAADLRTSLSGATHPTAVLVGEDDRATPPAMAQELAALTGAGAATVVPGTRHLTPLENPEAVVASLEALTCHAPASGPGAAS
ncbi:alpha/beta fold hydrolase [Streptomyces nanshensis]|uniref:Lactone hydrolase n=1 Tax=Streptomyces nanshensis TaxID=518642 RepID=A0A1E7L854_9ACTN|nr:alpha/beta fold hydrolase [Streptomyces nanshensis]OEV12386.1 lactone hydrolase [Streptomyces nanshensis]